MTHKLILLISFSVFSLASLQTCSTPESCSTGPTFTISSAGECRKSLKVNMGSLEGFIGVGWDNLMNKPMGPVFLATFELCRTTPDYDFLIPDDMVVIPIKKINLDRSASFYSSFHEYTSAESQTINVDVSASYWHVSVSGSYSHQHIETKLQFFNEKSSMFHTNLEYHAYDIPDQLGSTLHPVFLAQLQDITYAIRNNMTRRAQYLSQLLIRNYGTHVITQAKLGAKISQEDYVDSNTQYNNASSIDTMKASASASFYSVFKAKISEQKTTSQAQQDEYQNSLRYSKIRTNGGPDVNDLLTSSLPMSTNITQQGLILVKDLVATDRSGLPLFMMINRDYLPNNPDVDALRVYIKNATDEYYKRNTVFGCTDPNDVNFNFQANVDDGTCIAPANNYTFAGVYQTCSPIAIANGYTAPDSVCNKYRQINEITADYSCPSNYEPVLLYSGTHQLDCFQEDKCCHRVCHRCWVFLKCCNDVGWKQTDCDIIRIQSYWCRAKQGVQIPDNTGEMFGGLYVDGGMNMITGATGCPGRYRPYRLGLDLNICMSRDYQLDFRYAKKFQGFFSCQTQQGCTDGYSQHFATTIYGCDVYYCVRPETFNKYIPRPIIRPPFLPISALINETQSSVALYLNNTLVTKNSMKDILKQMYTFNVENVADRTNTDIKPFSISNSILQWSTLFSIEYSNNMTTTPAPSAPNPTVEHHTKTP